jgi:hypothetical protein
VNTNSQSLNVHFRFKTIETVLLPSEELTMDDFLGGNDQPRSFLKSRGAMAQQHEACNLL